MCPFPRPQFVSLSAVVVAHPFKPVLTLVCALVPPSVRHLGFLNFFSLVKWGYRDGTYLAEVLYRKVHEELTGLRYCLGEVSLACQTQAT